MESLKFTSWKLLIVILNLDPARAYSGGAPNIACAQMQPGHGFQPQSGEPPAKLIIEKVI